MWGITVRQHWFVSMCVRGDGKGAAQKEAFHSSAQVLKCHCFTAEDTGICKSDVFYVCRVDIFASDIISSYKTQSICFPRKKPRAI